MDHLAFYNTGCEPAPGLARLKVWARRRARKLLLPPSLRLVEILASLCQRLDYAEMKAREIDEIRQQLDDLRRRQEEQAGRLPATIAFGWDYVAMVRRLSVLEEHVDALLNREAAEPAPAESSVRFPILEGPADAHPSRSRLA